MDKSYKTLMEKRKKTKGNRRILVAPSILAGDIGALAREAKRAQKAGADWLHVDIMDGVFVPNITMGPGAVRALKKAVTIPLDVHLMLKYPQNHVKAFVEAGASFITVHVEAKHNKKKTLRAIRKRGCRCGLVLNPDTRAEKIKPYLNEIDMVLVMSVYPGFSYQKFIARVLPKISLLRKIIDESGRKIYLQVDGGINGKNAGIVAEAGADVLVSGGGVYGAKDLKKAIGGLRNCG